MIEEYKRQEDEHIFFPGIEDRELAGRLFEVEFTNIARRAGIPEELLYAVHKCSFVVTVNNEHKFTKAELRQWQKAIEEYQRGKGKLPY